jgi:alanyl-tRNA synthetase
MTFLIAEGVTPSNEGRGYVLRRLIRRAVQHGRRIGLEGVYRLPAVVVEQVGPWYPEVIEHADEIARVVRAEEERFAETLERGLREFEELAGQPSISAADAFRLAATYGFPIELTAELAVERGQAVDVDGFREEMARHREISRSGGEKAHAQRAAGFSAEAGFATEFVGYETTEVRTQIGALEQLGGGLFLAKLRESPFYPDGGGQVTDAGWIEKEGARAELVSAFRLGDDQALVFEGEGFAAGDRVRAVVPWRVRFPTMANHTATHLLHRALQEVLGEHVRQAGSAVRPDKLRFDFTHPQALTGEERERVEELVNERIFENLPVRALLTSLDEARSLGAMMLFGEKYGDVVRLVEVEGFSRELCGGTHVRATAEIGPFAILSEGSVGSGVRRIEAVTSGEAFAYLRSRAHEADDLRRALEEARRDARKASREGPAHAVVDEREHEVDGVRLYLAELENADADTLLEVSDREKQRRSPAVVVLGAREDGRVHLVVNVDPAVVDRGVDASAVVRAAAALVGGGGGGRPTMARAGGRDPEKLGEALAEAEKLLLAALG